jgi:hypothetical protein
MSDPLDALLAAFDARDAARQAAPTPPPEPGPFGVSLIRSGYCNKVHLHGTMGGVDVLADGWMTDEQVQAGPAAANPGVMDAVVRIVVVHRYDPADYADDDAS